MGLESPVTYISDLVSTNPTTGDPKNEGDDHLRNIKSAIKATFPNVSGAVNPTHTELNYVDGVTSAIQTQLDALASVTQNTQNANYTLVAGDANKHIIKTNTTAYDWTIPQNSSVAYSTGTVITLINNGSSGAITVKRDTNVVLRLAGTGGDANRTLAAYGLATIIKVGTNEWYISGSGLS